MTWVSWRQHRSQAIACLGLFCALAIFAIAAGAWMRTTFSDDGLAGCLARSGGAGCPAAITSFVHRFNGAVAITVIAALFAIPGLVGVMVGAPLLSRELEQGTWRLAWSQTVPRTRWLVAKLALVSSGLVVFGAAITAVMTWYRQPLDRLTTRLQPLRSTSRAWRSPPPCCARSGSRCWPGCCCATPSGPWWPRTSRGRSPAPWPSC
jgi:hypothetical protein